MMFDSRGSRLVCGTLMWGLVFVAPTAANGRLNLKTRVLLHSAAGVPVYKAATLTRAELAGEYQTTMLGDTDFLTLRTDGSYRLENWSCGGMTSSQYGRWMLDGSGIRFSIRRTKGGDRNQAELWRHRLDLVRFEDQYLMAPTASPDRIERYGLEPHRFLHQKSIRGAITREFVRHLQPDFQRRSKP